MLYTIKSILNSMWNDDNPLDVALFMFTLFFVFITLGIFVLSPLSLISGAYIRAILIMSLVWYIKYLFYKDR